MEDLFTSVRPGGRSLSCAASGILGVCAETMARWFSVMREAVLRERARQARFREDNGLPKSARIPYSVPALTDSDVAVSSLSESVMGALFGDKVSSYAAGKFRDAIETGDMRAFKIRLVFLKARDSIPDAVLKREFACGMEAFIDEAEQKAGCRQDSSPRRLSRKEQERKKRLDKSREARRVQQEAQLELPLIWTSIQKNDITEAVSDSSNIEHQEVVSESFDDRKDQDVLISRYCKQHISDSDEESKTPIKQEHGEHYENPWAVTVTEKERYCNVCYRNNYGIPRKTRRYDSVEDILNDIDEGRIVPYESQEEIAADVDDGFLAPEEAVMFVAALDHYAPEDVDMRSGEGFCDDEEAAAGDEDEIQEDEDDVSTRGTRFSYNPNGFGGFEDGDEEW